jgi:arylsulfatase
MSDTEQLDVRIAVYLIPDLAQQDFDEYVRLAGEGEIDTDGIALVLKDADGEVKVQESGDHLGRRGAKAGAGAGLVLGLFAPPLLAATAVGAAAGGLTGKFARHRMEAGIGDKLDDALPPGSAGVITVYDHAQAELVDKTLANSIRSSTAQIDKASAKELKEGLADAGAGLAGG